jgi:hypothetical protein
VHTFFSLGPNDNPFWEKINRRRKKRDRKKEEEKKNNEFSGHYQTNYPIAMGLGFLSIFMCLFHREINIWDERKSNGDAHWELH